MLRSVWSGVLLVGLLAGVSCGQPQTEAVSTPSHPSDTPPRPSETFTGFGECDDSGRGSDSPSLRELVAAGGEWELVRAHQLSGDPFFASFLGAETGRWVQAICSAAWTHDTHGGLLLIKSFQFDTHGHAADVWARIRDVEGWEERYDIDGLPSIHVAVAENLGGTGLHEAYRHVGRHLVTFAFTGGSPTARPDPTLERILRHHVQEFPD